MALPVRSLRTILWREGTPGAMQSRLADVTVRAAHPDEQRSQSPDEEWQLIESLNGKEEPTRQWISTVSQQAALEDLVCLAMLR
jgi:SRSO17 transposase